MKRTELEKRERELRRSKKKEELLSKKGERTVKNAAYYIDQLHSLYRFDQNEIFNASDDIAILEVLEEFKLDIPEAKQESILRKSIKKTGISNKDKAFTELRELLES